MEEAKKEKKLLAEIKSGKGIGYDAKKNQLEVEKARMLIKITAKGNLQKDRVQESVMSLRKGERKHQHAKSIFKKSKSNRRQESVKISRAGWSKKCRAPTDQHQQRHQTKKSGKV